MSWNVILKGYNTFKKLITRGFGATGEFVTFCAIRDLDHVCIKLRTK